MIKDLFENELKHGDLIVDSYYGLIPAIIAVVNTFNIQVNHISELNIKKLDLNKNISFRSIMGTANKHLSDDIYFCKTIIKIDPNTLSDKYKKWYDIIYKHVKLID